jgi:CDGSH-type Zn-finger protein
MTSIRLTALPDDPYRLECQVTILDRDGRPMPDRGAPVPLCRCGRSADKPFCDDGWHARVGWREDA